MRLLPKPCSHDLAQGILIKDLLTRGPFSLPANYQKVIDSIECR